MRTWSPAMRICSTGAGWSCAAASAAWRRSREPRSRRSVLLPGGDLGLVLGDHPVGDGGRHLCVMVELPAEAAATLRDASELGGVVEHLGLRDLRPQLLHAVR